MIRTYTEVKNALASGDTVVRILEGYLSQIEANKHLNAFLEVFKDSARAKAVEVDQKN
jgi:aspartyl-tRNA(Asn)/glutamyl-tRNA(Gln) amidotransferase subunit A